MEPKVEAITARTIARTKTEAMKIANEEFPGYRAVGAVLKDRAKNGYSAADNSRLVGSKDLFFYKVEMMKRLPWEGKR